MIIFGMRNFGSTDVVPGLFHVQTSFFHVDFAPLVPLNSYLVIDNNNPRYRDGRNALRGIEIPISGKSVGVAWLRFISGAFLLGTFIWLVIASSTFNDNTSETTGDFFRMIFPPIVTFCMAVVIVYLTMIHKITRNASYERATEIVSLYAGPTLGPQLQVLVDRHFAYKPTSPVAMAVATVISDDDHEDENIVVNDLELTEDNHRPKKEQDGDDIDGDSMVTKMKSSSPFADEQKSSSSGPTASTLNEIV